VDRGGKVVATVKGAAATGRNSLRWNGRLRGGKRAPAGSYTLKLTAVGADGQKASKTARLTLKGSR
jgi:flagellar hook assembly protein FlgD